MPVTRKYGQFSAELYTDGMGSPVLLGGQLRSSLRTGTTQRVEPTDGVQYPVHQAIYSQEPTAEMQSYSIQTVLDQIGTQGLAINGQTNPGLTIFAYLRQDGGARAPGATSRAYKLSDGILLPDRISVDHRGDAQIDYRADVTYDGANEPIVIIEGATIPVPDNNNERFTLGPLAVGGVAFDELTSAEIVFGVNTTVASADSDIWPTHVSIDDVIASVRFTGLDLQWLSAAGIPFAGGRVTTHVNGEFFLRRRDRATVSQFAVGATNLSFSFDGLAYISDAMDATGNTGASVSMEIPIVWDGTNLPLVYSSNVAVP